MLKRGTMKKLFKRIFNPDGKSMSSDENEMIENEKVSSGRIDFVIKFNKQKNVWQLVPPNTPVYELFIKNKNNP